MISSFSLPCYLSLSIVVDNCKSYQIVLNFLSLSEYAKSNHLKVIQVVVKKLMFSLGPKIIKSIIWYGVASELELHVGFGKIATAWLCKVVCNYITYL